MDANVLPNTVNNYFLQMVSNDTSIVTVEENRQIVGRNVGTTQVRVFSPLQDGLYREHTISVIQDQDCDFVGDAEDVDVDGNGYVDIESIEALDSIRHYKGTISSLRGTQSTVGTQKDIVGFELTRNLDFKNALHYKSGIVNAEFVTGNGWNPIDTLSMEFNGNGYRVQNLKIITDKQHAGFVGVLSASGKISNLGIDSIAVTVNAIHGTSHDTVFVGGLTGYNLGEVSRCYVSSGDNTISSLIGIVNYTGGLVGWNQLGKVSHSYFTGGVSSSTSSTSIPSNSYAGGIIGYNQEGSVSLSYSKGFVQSSSSSTSGNSFSYVGGITGYNEKGTVKNTYSTTAVSSSGNTNFAGGLVGKNTQGTVQNSYVTGTVSANTSTIGRLIGQNSNGTVGFIVIGVWSLGILERLVSIRD